MLRSYPSNSVYANVVFSPNDQLSIKPVLLGVDWIPLIPSFFMAAVRLSHQRVKGGNCITTHLYNFSLIFLDHMDHKIS